MLRYKLDLV